MTRSRCRQFLRCLIGRKAATDTAVSSVLPSGSSVIGTSFWLRLDIPNGATLNLSATVPGWTRHTIAEQMLARFYGPLASAQNDISHDFQVFMDRLGSGVPQSEADREALFRQFLQWREQQGRQAR